MSIHAHRDFPFYSAIVKVFEELLVGSDVQHDLFAAREGGIFIEESDDCSIVVTKGMAIAQEWRSMGLARIMLDHRLTVFRSIGATFVLTIATNPRVQHILKGMNFKAAKELDFGTALEMMGVGREYENQPDDPACIQLLILPL